MEEETRSSNYDNTVFVIVVTMLLFVCVTVFSLWAKGVISPYADMSEYGMSDGYETPYRYVETDVAGVVNRMDAGESMMVFCGFPACPWCQKVVNLVNDVADEHDVDVYYINTKKDPSWESNMDMTDYDLFVERFGDFIDLDDDGNKHLYVPFVAFVKNGECVSAHTNTVADDRLEYASLGVSQKVRYKQIIEDGLTEIGF